MRTWLVGLLAFVVWIALAPSALAQNAQITGSVKDSSGAIIPGATVTARNVDTGLTRVGGDRRRGEYRLPSLTPGRYSVATELSGFSTETRPDIILIIDQTAIINFVAQAGGARPSRSRSPATRRSSTSRDRMCRRRCRRSRFRICRWPRGAGSISRC